MPSTEMRSPPTSRTRSATCVVVATTVRPLAEPASSPQVSLLALTHLSSRYFGPEIAREAREIFPDTVVPRDFDVVDVPFAERGTPQLIKGGAMHRREEPEPVSSTPQ